MLEILKSRRKCKTPSLAFVASASANPDTMYHHEAMRQPDRAQFLKAMEAEVASHHDRGHWKIQNKDEIPPNTKVLPVVWSMKRK